MIKFNKKISKKIETIITETTAAYSLNITVDQINNELKIKFQNPNTGYAFNDNPMPGTMDAIGEFWKMSESIIAKLEKTVKVISYDFYDCHNEDFILSIEMNY